MRYSFFKLSLLICSFILTTTFYATAQENSQTSNYQIADQDSLKERPGSIYAGLGYGSNMIYMGSNVSQDKPFYSGSLTYGFKNELFVSLSASHLSAFDPAIAFSSASISYNHDFNSWFDISPGISRYQVNNELTDTLFSNFFYGNLSLGFDWKILYTSISAGGLFSDENSLYFNLRNSRYFQSPDLFNSKAFFYVDPYINLLFGELTKTVTSEGTTIGVSPPFKPKASSGGGGGGNSSGITTTFLGIMEADFGIPVGFTIGKFTIEAEPGYVLPAFSDIDTQSPEGFSLLINIYCKIL